MPDPVTQPTSRPVPGFLASVDNTGRREDAIVLDKLFQEVTGWQPHMWGPSIVGYGAYDYTYDTGHSGTCQATGFSPRKGNMVIYIMPGYAGFGEILSRVGPHKMGKACLYLGRLSKVDLPALGELIRAGLDDLETKWPVRGS